MTNISEINVSVIVASYNSARTIIDTLESIKAQSYPNIELIIADDCSRDKTIELFKEWSERNKDRFNRVVIVKSDINTGVSANVNRGVLESRGEWIKSIAADDILLPNCIEDNLEYIKKNPDTKVVFSRMINYYEEGNKDVEQPVPKMLSDFFEHDVQNQYHDILKGVNWINTPTCFIDAKILKKYPFNEEYPHLEDIPKWLDLTKKGIRLNFMNKLTVKYRIGSGISTGNKFKKYNKKLQNCNIRFFYDKIYPECLRLGYHYRIEEFEKRCMLYFFTIYFLNNKTTGIKKYIYRLAQILIFHFKNKKQNYD